jgi:hypothetical protein
VVTVTTTEPFPAGDVAVTEVVLLTVTWLAAFEPNCTLVTPVRLVPVMVTLVPPAAGPEAGAIAVTTGVEATASAIAVPVPNADAPNSVSAATGISQRHRC